MPTRVDINRLLARGVAAAKAGQRAQAYGLLLEVVEVDERNELGWLWLSTVAENLDDQRICLENVLTINPENKLARQRLTALPSDGDRPSHASSGIVICPQCGAGNHDFVRECKACGFAFFVPCPTCGESNPTDTQACNQCGSLLAPGTSFTNGTARHPAQAPASTPVLPHPTAPITLWPAVAFWMSVSIFFIGGGAASLLQFINIWLHARGVVQNLSLIQVAWLPVSLFFIVFGFTGLSLAWQLARRRPGGYYGSMIFGLVLTLLGPSAGLILDPPNYMAVACTGLTPAAAVLFTVASMAGFEFYTKES